MLKFVTCKTFNALLDRLTHNMSLIPNSEFILLVPETLSHETEMLLCKYHDLANKCEVLSFTKLCGKILDFAGGGMIPHIEQGTRILLMAKTLRRLEEKLGYWHRAVGNRKYLTALLDAIDEFEDNCVGKRDIIKYYSDYPSKKFEELHLIWETYTSLAEEVGFDARNRLKYCINILNSGKYTYKHPIFIYGFVSFTVQELEILRAFIHHTEVHTYQVIDMQNIDDIWKQSMLSIDRLRKIAIEVGSKVEFEHVPPIAHDMSALEDCFLSEDTSEKPSNSTIKLCICENIFSEAEAAVNTVKQWLSDGIKLSEMSVICANYLDIQHILAVKCEQNGIIVFSESKLSLAEQNISNFIVAIKEIILYGFERESVISLIKSEILQLNSDDIFLFDEYLRVNGIGDEHWVSGNDWIASPQGWGAKIDGTDSLILARINSIRAKTYQVIGSLKSRLRQCKSASEMCGALYEFFIEVKLPESLKNTENLLIYDGFIQHSEQIRQIWIYLCKTLDCCAEVMENCEIEEFFDLFSMCLSQYMVATIPDYTNCLKIAPIDKAPKFGVKRLIITGAADEYMPRKMENTGIISDEDRVKMEESGIFMSPRAEARVNRELFDTYQLIALPTEALVVTYPKICGGIEQKPSAIFDKLVAYFQINPEYFAVIRSNNSNWSSKRENLLDGSLIPNRISPSMIERYNLCKFRFFLESTLKYRADISSGPKPSDAGKMLHYVLESMVNYIKLHGKNREFALSVAKTAAEDYIAAIVAKEMCGARTKAILYRLIGTALSVAENIFDELAASDFAPDAVESRFDAFVENTHISGIADRVDIWDSGEKICFRVVDYKSGAMSFSLRDIWNGLNLQTLCYMFLMPKYEQLQAVGTMYVPIGDRFMSMAVRENDENLVYIKTKEFLRREGIILDDSVVIEAMEHGEKKLFLPLTRDKPRVVSAGQLGLLKRHTYQLIGSVKAAMDEGVVDAKPLWRNTHADPCAKCDWRLPCWKTEREGCEIIAEMREQAVWELMEDRYGFATER